MYTHSHRAGNTAGELIIYTVKSVLFQFTFKMHQLERSTERLIKSERYLAMIFIGNCFFGVLLHPPFRAPVQLSLTIYNKLYIRFYHSFIFYGLQFSLPFIFLSFEQEHDSSVSG